MSGRLNLLGLIGVLAASPVQAAQGGLTEAGIRAFAARQERAWNREDAAGYFAGFTPGAVFVDQTLTGKGETIVYGRSTLTAARAHSKRYFAKARFTERGVIARIVISPDRRTARVFGLKTTQLDMDGRKQTLCAQTDQRLVWTAGRILSQGQTDTTIRCQGVARPPRRSGQAA